MILDLLFEPILATPVPGSASTVAFESAAGAAAVLGLAWIVTAALRRGSAATRHLVWTVAVIVAMILPALELGLPGVAVPVPDWPGGIEGIPVPGPGSTLAVETPTGAGFGDRNPPASSPIGPVESVTSPTDDTASTARDLASPARGMASAAGSVTSPAGGVTSPAARTASGAGGVAPRRSAGWRAILLAAWACGALLVLGMFLLERLHLLRRASRAREDRDGPVARAVERLQPPSGRRPKILIGRRNAMPMTWGLWRPVLLMPDGCDRWPVDRLEIVLRHELAHVRRRDHLIQVLATFLAAVHWFDPLAWLALRRLQTERELACDDEVLNAGTRPSTYATELLGIARALDSRPSGSLLAAAMARPSKLSGRLRAVLQERRRRRLDARLVATGAAVGLLVALPVAALTTSGASSGPSGTGEPAPTGGSTATASTKAPETPPAPWAPGSSPAGPARPQGDAAVSECWAPGVDRNHMVRRDGDREEYTWSSSGCHATIVLQGEVELDDSFTRIVGGSPGGYFRLELDEDGVDRLLEIRPASDAGVEVLWRVDGRTVEFDAEARRWFAAVLVNVLRQTGLAAEERAAAIYAERGARGVVEEVERIDSDSVIGRYLAALVRQPGLGDAELRRAVEIAGDRIGSNSTLSEFLQAFAEARPEQIVGAPVSDAFWSSVAAVESDSTLADLLVAVMEGDPDDAVLAVASLEMARMRISSNSTLADFLLDVARLSPDAPRSGPLRDHFWRTVDEISSNSTLAELLIDLTAGEPADSALVATAVERARTGISSDSTLAGFLLDLTRAFPEAPTSGPLYDEFWAAVETISSSSTLADLLLDVPGRSPSSELLRKVLETGRTSIGSSSTLADFLVDLARRHPEASRGPLREELLAAARAIDSRSSREEALDRLEALGVGR